MPMPAQEPSDLEKIRQQFDQTPYPRIPLDESPKQAYEALYIHNLVTGYYLRHRRLIDSRDTWILDAGCGTGFKSLILAEANPGAHIVGVDLSEESVKLARERLKYHGFPEAEFHALAIEELPQLGRRFDYINCDEVLYLLPDPVAGLKALKAVLNPNGLMRANLHNAHQRAPFYRAQHLFKAMGLMDETPTEFEEGAVIETMEALKDSTRMRAEGWAKLYQEAQETDRVAQMLGANYLLQGDKGFTIPELFAILAAAGLEFVSMVNWRHWDVADLFRDPDNLPALWSMGLANASVPDKLHLYELMHPTHRLMDFWCAHPGEAGIPVDEWQDADWQQAIAHLHPQLRSQPALSELLDCLETAKPFEISRFVPLPAQGPVLLDCSRAACLLPLWEAPQPIAALVDRYQRLHPVNSITLDPLSQADAFAAVKQLLNQLDAFLYVLVERSNQ